MIKLSPFQWAAFNFFGFFCAYGVLLPFLPVWLKFHGYSTEIIGLLAAFGYLFRFTGGMLASQRVKNPNELIPTARAMTWLNLATVVLVAWSVDSLWLLLPALMLFHIFNAGAMPIGDSIASIWQQQIGLDYGKARLFGSIAFVVGSITTGYVVGWFGENSILWMMGAFLVLLSYGQLLTPKAGFANSSNQRAECSLSYWQIFKQPTTMRMMITISLIMASHAAYYTYSTIHWSEAGIPTQTISLLWGLAVTAEILFFLVSTRLFKAWKIHHLMMFATVMAMIRWSVLASTTEVSVLVIFQTFHALTFGVGHYAMIRYISSQPAENITKLQGLYFGLASCAVMALMTFISGVIYQHSPNLVFWIMAIFVAPALLIVPKVSNVRSQAV